MTTDETTEAYDWHYVISLQGGEVQPFLLSTQHGFFGGYVDEEAAFTSVWDTACRNLTAKTKRHYGRDNTTVLFYRLERAVR